jgi:hypothetical protein
MAGLAGWRFVAGASARLVSLWQGVRRRAAVEADIREEFRHHIALRAEDLVRGGVPVAEAARRAHLEFGHFEGLREEARASRGLGSLDRLPFSWLDVEFGVRMLRKVPGLSRVSVRVRRCSSSAALPRA